VLALVGIVFVVCLVFGGYILSGGKFGIIIKALPYEMMIIGGAAVGAYLIGNRADTIKATGGAFKIVFKGAKWKKQDYLDLLCLMFSLTKLMRTKGMMAVEAHIENPSGSNIFSAYPSIQSDHFASDFICDTLRLMTMAMDDPHQVEDLMEKKLEKHHHEAEQAGHALQTMADGIPALGIVAAVLGVIKTMASIDQPPPILGKMIGGALTGTFLGVYLAYGFVGPFANKVLKSCEQDAQFYYVIRDIIVSHLQGNAPQISVEIGRGNVPSHLQPTFNEVEGLTSSLKVEG